MKKYKLTPQVKRLLKHNSRTLYLSFVILPDYVKYMLSYAYLIARAMDSVVDSKRLEHRLKVRFIKLITEIDREGFYSELLKIKADITGGVDGWEKELLENLNYIIEEFFEVIDEIDKRNVRFLLKGLSAGMQIDLLRFDDSGRIRSISTFNELIKYANLIGGIPALYWHNVYLKYNSRIFKNNVFRTSFRIGSALQLTNILKDINEDIKNGRCYIPKEYLDSVKIKEEDLLNPSTINKVRNFIDMSILTCINFFDESELLIDSLDLAEFSFKLALIWPIYWAMDTLYLVSVKNPLKGKIKISRLNVYKTLIKSPLLLTNHNFRQGYRFKRETLILSINSKNIIGEHGGSF